MIFEDLERCSRNFEILADFKKPARAFNPVSFEDFSVFRCQLELCLRYVRAQWFIGTPKSKIRDNVLFTVHRGLDAHGLVQGDRMRGLHDLLLATCALFVCTSSELRDIANSLVEATGDEPNNGELHYRAWSGALRGLLKGDKLAAKAQYKQLEGSRCPNFARTGSRTFLHKAIDDKWEDFQKLQRKDFERLWARSRKDGTLRGDLTNPDKTVVRLSGWPPEQLWCWTHVALALWGHRKGARVETDPLWFPAYALECVGVDLVEVTLPFAFEFDCRWMRPKN